MVATEKVLFSLQMAEESFQEVQLLSKDGKTRSLLNSLYNLYYYGIEAILLGQDIHCRSHIELKNAFMTHILRRGLFRKADEKEPIDWEKEIESIFNVKNKNENGILPSKDEVLRLVQAGEHFLKRIRNHLLI
ncbi:MAG: hypothetical protein HY200_01380 [Nitrospirae bacterium]|nr:hypothetical protein [Nitrospirota bacterium]MBI3593589.1 hypothetical protein [Nitrospirota bacterium]